MRVYSDEDIEALLDAWPRLRRRPGTTPHVCTLAGSFEFESTPKGLPCIADTYALRLDVPMGIPDVLLRVAELGGRLRWDPDDHVNSDGSLCLGSPLRLRLLQRESQGLVAFVEASVVPFLYAASWRAQGNKGYPFSELAHFGAGLIDDYSSIVGFHGHLPVAHALAALSLRRRVANKRPCPCGGGRRLGACACRTRLNGLRRIAPRRLWKQTHSEFLVENPLPRVPRRFKGSSKLRKLH
ncbi:MAG: hypothetical protein H0T88_01495 [Lysobacter sp.]|nr:hypothetical protein [Lysobacter sp.]